MQKENEGCYIPKTQCSVYIGKKAGEEIIDALLVAEHSIKIMSPYLNPTLIEELIRLHQKGIQIELITSDTIEDHSNPTKQSIQHQLIQQEQQVNQKALSERQNWKWYRKLLTFSTILLLVLPLILFFQSKEPNYLFCILIAAGCFFAQQQLTKRLNEQVVYTYSYHQLFPFKAFLQPRPGIQNALFVHAKMYIIDDQVAFLGSLNFTTGGLKRNFETCIRIDDTTAVTELVETFNALFCATEHPEKNLALWGQNLYDEPIH